VRKSSPRSSRILLYQPPGKNIVPRHITNHVLPPLVPVTSSNDPTPSRRVVGEHSASSRRRPFTLLDIAQIAGTRAVLAPHAAAISWESFRDVRGVGFGPGLIVLCKEADAHDGVVSRDRPWYVT
jgi:hypothetical protein